MPRNGLPYFPLDVDDYLEDEAVVAMSAEAEGCYIRLLCRSWKSKTPGVINAAIVGELCGIHRVPEIDRERVLSEVSRAFVVDDARWTQRRMMIEFRRAEDIYDARKRGARKTNAGKDIARSPRAERALTDPVSGRSPRVGVGVGVVLPSKPESYLGSHVSRKPDSIPTPARTAVPASAAPPPVIELPLRDGTLFPVHQHQVERWQRTFPDVAILATLREMVAWLDANPTRRKTRRGAARFVIGWLMREQNRPDNAGGKRNG